MTIASHRRRLDALAPTERPLTLGELLEDSDEEKAVKAVCAFARALVAPPPPATPGARHSSAAFSPPKDARPSAEVTLRESRGPSAHPPDTKPERLDPREVVTFEEAMRQPWIGIEPIKPSVPPEDQPPPPRRPRGWIDPWGGGGFLFPSYAGDEQE